MAERAIVPGRTLAGRYRLESKLGEGGFGQIWRAEHLVLCAPVALKIIDREVGADEEALGRFMREARAAATLRSPHVVQILDYGVDEGVPFIAMELLEGETLAQRLSRQGRLSAAETVMVVSHIARAIGRAHDAGIIHRDLKPENCFIVHNEDAEIIKVLDFGVAKMNTADLGPKGTRTRTGSLLGTPFYMSPEQAQGNKTVDHRTDLWALGVMTFECLTGSRPFESEGLGDLVLQICVRPLPNPSELAPVPRGFDAWFQKACAREADDRFQSAREMVDALRLALGLEGRETYAALSDGETDGTSARARVQSGASPKVKLDEPTPRPAKLENADTVVVPSPRKAAATLGQFGTTHGPPPKPSNRTALLVSVGGIALLIGLGAGFVVIKRRQPPAPLPDPIATAETAADPEAVSDAAPGSEEDKDAQAAAVETTGDGAAKAATDAGKDAKASVGPSGVGKGDKPPKGDKDKDAGAAPVRDWGKEEPAPTGSSIFEPVPPAAPQPPFMKDDP